MLASLMPFVDRARSAPGTWLLAVVMGVPGLALAQGFAAYVSPPRFEVQAKPGETRRHVMEIHHVGQSSGRFRIYTSDPVFKDDFSVHFSEGLQPDSCRPWVALERRELTVAPNARYRFRFEVTPPAGSPSRECRFAVMVEGLDTTKVKDGNFDFPVAGRIGVIVYVQVGDAAAKLSIGKASVQTLKGNRVPVLEVENKGNATGRLEGFMLAKDGAGKEFELAPDNAPILPGKSRAIMLYPVVEEGVKPPVIQYPLTAKGTLEWGKNRESLDLRFEP